MSQKELAGTHELHPVGGEQQTMQVAISFPVCSKEMFAQLSGFSPRYVQHLLNEGLLPILPKHGQRAKVIINLDEIRRRCLDASQPLV